MANYIENAIECLKNLEFKEAMEFIHLSYSENDDLSIIHNLLGIYYELNGDLNLARKHYRASLDLYPGYNSPKNNLQRVCEFKHICSIEYIDFGETEYKTS